MVLNKINEHIAIKQNEGSLHFKTLKAFKKFTSYCRRFIKEKFLYYRELKRKTSCQRLLSHIEKEFKSTNESLEKKQLVQSIQKAIDRYQNIVQSQAEPPPKPQTQKRVLQQQTAYKAESKVLNSLAFSANCDYKPSQQELDAFRMKAISLMRKNGMLPETISEALKSPILVNIGEVIENNNKHLMIKLSQRFERLGEEFELQGIFLKNIKQSNFSIPLSDTFQISKSK